MAGITGLSHVVLHCHDVPKMVAFYHDVLGLKVNNGHRDPERLTFLTADPETEDHEIALTKGRQGDAKIIAHIAFRVKTPDEVKGFYDRFIATGVPIDHMVSHAYVSQGNTVSCYFLDPEGNKLEIFAVVKDRDPVNLDNHPIDLGKSIEEIVAQASGLASSAAR